MFLKAPSFRYALLLSGLFFLAAFLYTFFIFDPHHVPRILFLTFFLGVLEVSLSFDNAVVHASILQSMPRFWQKAYLSVGIFIAVFGVRFLMPLVIFDFMIHIPLWEALQLAFKDPKQYADVLHKAHPQIVAFGGTFLGLMGTHFFINTHKQTHWIPHLEKALAAGGRFLFLPLLSVGTLLGLSLFFIGPALRYSMMIPAAVGVVSFYAIRFLSSRFAHPQKSMHSGFVSFLYLELIDISFSIDSVVGATAIVRDIFIMLCGLGIGAVFVRSLTIYIVHKGTLEDYKYLENGAFWAIAFLSVSMFISLFFHLPEWVIAMGSFLFIMAAFIASRRASETSKPPL